MKVRSLSLCFISDKLEQLNLKPHLTDRGNGNVLLGKGHRWIQDAVNNVLQWWNDHLKGQTEWSRRKDMVLSLHSRRMNYRLCDEMLEFVQLNYGTSPESAHILPLSFIAAIKLDIAGCYAFCFSDEQLHITYQRDRKFNPSADTKWPPTELPVWLLNPLGPSGNRIFLCFLHRALWYNYTTQTSEMHNFLY
jgi:hypothetical protein